VTGDEAKFEDLYKIGTIVNIKRMMRNEGVMQLIVQGMDRFEVKEWISDQPYLKAKVEILPELRRVDDEEIEALKRNIQGMIQQALALLPQVPPEIRMAVMTQQDPVQLAYFLASVLDLGTETEQKMLESSTVDGLLTLTHAALARELEIMQIRSKIATEAQGEMDKAQRDYVLRQQLKQIQKELGEDESGEKAEATQLRERLEAADLPEDVRKGSGARIETDGSAPAGCARLSRHSNLSRIRHRASVEEVERRASRSERGSQDPRRRSLRSRRHQGAHSRIARRC
jgi:ATP-dependent Lon protease